MRRNVQSSIAASLLLGAILVIALNTWFAVSSVRLLQENSQLVAHTWQVIGQIERVIESSKDAEASVRGYIISGDPSYVSLYQTARGDLPKEIAELQALTADNAVQQRHVAILRPLINERTEVLTRSVRERDRAGLDAGQSDLLVSGGKDQMTRLAQVSAEMQGEERRLLTLRDLAMRRSGSIATFAIGLASFLDFLLIIAIFRYFARERELRLETEKAAEEALLAREDALRSAEQVSLLNAELEARVRQRTAELETTNRELEAFSYSVSHDLRAPLRTIDGFSLALEEDYASAVGETGKDYIRRVRVGVQRMGGLIDALLQLSRITRAEITRDEVDVTALARLVADNLKEENPGCDLRFTIASGMTANADPKLLQVAFENLMGNAVKFSSKKAWAEIEVGWSQTDRAWFVSDHGAGFDMHYREKLFNAFNRLHGDKDFKGSGIGLATVARVVRRHHGRIWADSQIDHGATFWFTLG